MMMNQVGVRARGECVLDAGPRYHQVQKVLIIIIHQSIFYLIPLSSQTYIYPDMHI
jgi:hypothetical protein